MTLVIAVDKIEEVRNRLKGIIDAIVEEDGKKPYLSQADKPCIEKGSADWRKLVDCEKTLTAHIDDPMSIDAVIFENRQLRKALKPFARKSGKRAAMIKNYTSMHDKHFAKAAEVLEDHHVK